MSRLTGWHAVRSGKFVWTVRNLALFREMIKTQKIMSPAFPAGECSLRLSVYQSTVAGADFLSLCLESKVGRTSPLTPTQAGSGSKVTGACLLM